MEETGIDGGSLLPSITKASVATTCRSGVVSLLTNFICLAKQLTLHRKLSASSVQVTHLSSSPVTHVSEHLDTESDQDDISEVDAEDDWFSNPQDIPPGASAASKVSKATSDEVRPLT